MAGTAQERRKAAMRDLDRRWGSAYVIFSGDGVYSATRMDELQVLTASSPSELRSKIIADYGARPVPRDRQDGSQP
jgi:protein involved in temperature-dependent protein secretion